MIATKRICYLPPAKRIYSLDDIFNFIVTYKRAHDGNSPTVRQIMESCDISSTSVVAYNLARLVVDGRIRITGNRVTRSIEVVGGRWTMGAA